jgi:hypothetical protein
MTRIRLPRPALPLSGALVLSLTLSCLGAAALAAPKCMGLVELARYDANLDTRIGLAEFPALAAARFQFHDKNGDRWVTDQEMGFAQGDVSAIHPQVRGFAQTSTSGATVISQDSWTQAARVLFDVLDLNGDGQVAIREYRSFCRAGYRF